jgi:lipopolysaccharide exporter
MTTAIPGSPAKQKVFRASLWSFALLTTESLLGVGRVVVLAIFLSPREFGLFGIAMLILLAADAMSRTGFQQALIQDKRDIRGHLDVAWTVQLARGVLLALVLLVISPYVASYFNEPAAIRLTQVVAIALVLQGLNNIGIVYFHKELDFRKEFTYRMSGTLADLVIAIIAAWLLHTAWALVLGLLAGNLVRLVASYWIHPYRPRIRIARQPLGELTRYGMWLSLTGILLFIGSRAAGLVVGKLAGATALGLYQMAYRIPQVAIRDVSAAVERVALPTYSLVQNEQSRLKRSYLGISGFSLALAAPAAIGIVVLGSDFTRFFLGNAWMPMVPALIPLAFAALIRAASATGDPLFQACGAPSLSFHMQCARAAALALLIYPFTMRGGIRGAAACILLTAVAEGTIWILGTRRILRLNARELGEGLIPPLLSSLAMGAVLYPLRLWTLPWVPEATSLRIVWMASLIVAGALVYIAGLWAAQRILPRSVLLETAKEIIGARGMLLGRGER